MEFHDGCGRRNNDYNSSYHDNRRAHNHYDRRINDDHDRGRRDIDKYNNDACSATNHHLSCDEQQN